MPYGYFPSRLGFADDADTTICASFN
ncbi:hypothetical protein PSEUDO8Z_10593 [Pseudomonas sp. 8Z]|nr:hypothetical protein PSEUDO8Z_10593 [Pseudomonas sp. 8Z]